MTFSKKTQIETSFNLVFMVFAGAIILLFFAIVIYNLQSSNASQQETAVVSILNSVLSGTRLGQQTSALLQDFPEGELLIECAGYSYGTSTTNFGSILAYGPSSTPINPLLIWTHEWQMPFFISNFIYMSSPNIKYIFIHSTSSNSALLKQKISSLLPEQLNTQFLTVSQNPSVPGLHHTRFVFLDTDPESYSIPQNFQNEKTSGIRISADNQLTFYSFDKQQSSLAATDSHVFYDDATLLSAIVTDSQEYYDCMLKKSFTRYSQAASSLSLRVSQLKEQRRECSNLYGAITGSLSENVKAFVELFNTRELTQQEWAGSVNLFNSLISSLKQLNQESLLQKSCPLIY